MNFPILMPYICDSNITLCTDVGNYVFDVHPGNMKYLSINCKKTTTTIYVYITESVYKCLPTFHELFLRNKLHFQIVYSKMSKMFEQMAAI